MHCECGHDFEPVIEYTHRVICGDSTDPATVDRLFAGAKPVLMVTDPPYGVEYDPAWRNEAAAKGLIAFAASREGVVANDERVDWSPAWALFPGDVVYCWHAGRHAATVQASLEAQGFETRSQIIWAKPNFAISRGHYHWQHEPCWYCVRKGANGAWAGDHSQTTLWKLGSDAADKAVEGGHGTQKPLECMARPIRNHHAPQVYDPFLGSGTTIIACEVLGRQGFGVELKPAYVSVCLERFQQFTGIAPERLEAVP